ncbi:MAG TPA: 3-oxoacid CoA-transferase subunit B [Dehalococcoidia bacterium]|nr:3-oxoacid CoA-transferase subunit B [Dehalococcoidia bacterium]
MRSGGLTRELIALRIARELRDGYYVNLGIGLPTLVSNFVPEGMEVIFHAENGILGYGSIITEGELDIDLINAGGQPVNLRPGAAIFCSAESFAMIRGRHIDLTVLGGLQVSEKGDLANWMLPTRSIGAIGGAMDLAVGAKRVIVAMEHTTKDGEPKIVKQCTYALTAKGSVNMIVTDLGVIDVTPQGLVLKEVAPGFTPEEVQALTEPRLTIAEDLKEVEL